MQFSTKIWISKGIDVSSPFLYCITILLHWNVNDKTAVSNDQLTCLSSVIALGWHLVQMPAGQGACSVQPGFILQFGFSRSANFPLKLDVL